MGQAEREREKQEALQARLSQKMLETQSKPTPFPEQLTTLEQWQSLDWTCVGDKRLLLKSLDDVPSKSRFLQGYKGPNGDDLHKFIRWRLTCAKKKKRLADLEAEREQKRLRGERPLDKSLFDGDDEAWEAAMKKAAWDDDEKRVVLGVDKFTKRGGDRAFWYKLKDDERAAKVLAAKVAESLRRSTRVQRPTKHYDPAVAAEQTGASPEDGSYPHLGVEKDEVVCRIILGEGGEEALKALGVDWVCGAWQSETALDMKLRGLMEQLSRILTIGAVTTQVHVEQALAALERELERRLATWYASLGAAPVAPLGASNHGDASSAPAACVGAAAADGANVRGGAATRTATSTACGGAASALGGRAETSSLSVHLAAAAARRLDLVRLVLDANEDVRTGAARFAGDASDASTAAQSADRLTRVARAASADLTDKHAICDALDGLPLSDTQFGLLGLTLLRAGFVTYDPTGKVVVGEPIRRMEARVAGLKPGEDGFGTKFYLHKVVLVAVQLAFANKLLDFKRMRLSLFQCVFGRYLLALWAWLNGLTLTGFLEMGLDPKMVVVEVKEDEVKLLPPAVADAFAGGVKFETAADLLTAHQNANTAFAAAKNRVFEDGRAAFNNGAEHIFEQLAAAAGGPTDAMDIDGAASLGATDAPRVSAAALRLVALAASAADAGLVAPRGGTRGSGDGGWSRRRLAEFCTAVLESATSSAGAPTHRRLVRCGDCEACRKRAGEPCRAPVPLVPSSVSARSVLARVDAALAEGGASGLAAATRIAADAAPRVSREMFLAVAIYAPPPPEMTFKCKIQFHTNTVDGWTDEFDIDDFYAVYAALRAHNAWSSSPAWVLASSQTGRAFEAGGQQILAGMGLEEMTAPISVCTVFDQEEKEDCEGTKYGTYTIFIGSDYQIAVPGQPRVDKCECIVDAVKAHIASRVASA